MCKEQVANRTANGGSLSGEQLAVPGCARNSKLNMTKKRNGRMKVLILQNCRTEGIGLYLTGAVN